MTNAPLPPLVRTTTLAEAEVKRVIQRLTRHFGLLVLQESPWLLEYDRSRYHLEVMGYRVSVVFEPPDLQATPVMMDVGVGELYGFLFELLST
jgi:hypothetical protein